MGWREGAKAMLGWRRERENLVSSANGLFTYVSFVDEDMCIKAIGAALGLSDAVEG